jgi:hypothetical protein
VYVILFCLLLFLFVVSFDTTEDMQALVELNDRNALHVSAKKRIFQCACDATRSPFTRTAERDLSLGSVTAAGVREAICCHIEDGKPILLERLDSGEEAYVFKECHIESTVLYVKLKFWKMGKSERILILSAHPDRRW